MDGVEVSSSGREVAFIDGFAAGVADEGAIDEAVAFADGQEHGSVQVVGSEGEV